MVELFIRYISATILGHVNQIRAQMEETTSEFDKEKLQKRLVKLAAGGTALHSYFHRFFLVRSLPEICRDSFIVFRLNGFGIW